jgi:hypothetical protein
MIKNNSGSLNDLTTLFYNIYRKLFKVDEKNIHNLIFTQNITKQLQTKNNLML